MGSGTHQEYALQAAKKRATKVKGTLTKTYIKSTVVIGALDRACR